MALLLIAITAAVRFFTKQGPVYWLVFLLSYICLKIARCFSRRRLDLYDLDAIGEPEKLGFFVPPEEWALETPQSPDHLEQKNSDGVFCMGINSNSESLAVHISREGKGKVRCSMAMRLKNGCTYTLPEEHRIQTEIDEPDTFGSSRFKMECILPMRKWRVFFNGILRETTDEDQTVRHRHVKFVFIWTASSNVFDYTSDIPDSWYADIIAKFWSLRFRPTTLRKSLRNMFGGYEQCGMLLGTVTIEDQPEKEVYLWGNRCRKLGQIFPGIEECKDLGVFINSENGTFIHLGILSVPGIFHDVPYGYVMKANGSLHPIESCSLLKTEDNAENAALQLVCTSGELKYTVELAEECLGSNLHGGYDSNTSVNQVIGHMNAMSCRGLIFLSRVKIDSLSTLTTKEPMKSMEQSLLPEYVPLSVPFHEPCCQLLSVSGGKGASLAKLTMLSRELKTFTVPKGAVVTTSGYEAFTCGLLNVPLKKLEVAVWNQDQFKFDVHSACERVRSQIIKTPLPESVKQSIERSLHEVFGKEINNIRFAVRSSATGEDTEQMSAAGQMDTFLGCRGISEVLDAVKKCWASQFSFVAVGYKRRYGQPLNTPMAVVIQEMVACEFAGVAFTCDPVTANPSYVSITANYGLGESVVSASADPDTVTLKRDLNNKLQIDSKTAGTKQSKIVMDDETGGTKEIAIDPEKSTEYSIDDNIALELGKIVLQVEMKFGAPRDVEWGVLNRKIYLFQARPVTTVDTETDFEAMHVFDTYLRREDEMATTANVGEVMPGAATPLGMDYTSMTFTNQKDTSWEGEFLPPSPYCTQRLCYAYNHAMFSLIDGLFSFSESDVDKMTFHTKATLLAIFGRLLDDKKIFEIAKDRHASEKERGRSIKYCAYTALYMLFAEHVTKQNAEKIEGIQIPILKYSSASEVLRTLSQHYKRTHIAMTNHINCTLASPYWNMILLNLLIKAKGGLDTDVYADFGYLLSCNENLESADIPSAIQRLVITISKCIDPEEFRKMTPQEALVWLQETPSEAAIQFDEFLARHGYRCIKEFDVYSKTWAMDPLPLIKTLQAALSKKQESAVPKKAPSFQEILSKMRVKLNFFQRLQLRLILPQCSRGVSARELGKALVIKAADKVRSAFHQLADAMVSEGRLPNRDLMFFLCVEELNQLMKTRSPKILARAFKRWKCHPQMDKMIFPEISVGIPKPINMNEQVEISADGLSMKGVPVSRGVVKGTARVIIDIEDASSIQQGDILITYSTDIAWSPYFPMLAGVVTELGGLISHGAVVAREYGLPCVVSVQGATRAFKSGDLVLLDGNRGTLQKVQE